MTKWLVFAALMSLAAHADESVGKKVHDAGVDADKNANKTVRKGKKQVRKATGKNRATDDINDAAKDAGDDVKAAREKAKVK